MSTTLVDTNWLLAADVGPVGANTELFDHWYDVLGSIWQNATGNLSSNGSTDDNGGLLLIDSALSSGVANQQIIGEFVWPVDSALDFNVIFRRTSSTTFYLGFFYSGGAIFDKVISNSATQLGTATFDQLLVPGRTYRVTWTLNGTTWSIALRDLTTSADLTWGGQPTASISDSSISASGRMGLSPRRANKITRTAAINLDGTATTLTALPESLTSGAVLGAGRDQLIEIDSDASTWTSQPVTPLVLTNNGSCNASIQKAYVVTDTKAILKVDAGNISGSFTLHDQTGTGTVDVTVDANTAIDQVFNIGDSLTETIEGLAESQTMLGVCLRYLGTSYKGSRFGQGGRTLSQDQDVSVRIDFSHVPSLAPGNNYLVICGGLNDFAVAGKTAAQVYAQLKAFLVTYGGLGWKVILVTLAPYGDLTNTYPGIGAFVAELNALIRDNWAADGFSGCIDLASAPIVKNTSAAFYNTDLYYSDRKHYLANFYETIWGPMQADTILGIANGADGGGGGGGATAYAY